MRGRVFRVSALSLTLLGLFLLWGRLVSAQPAPVETALVTTVTPIYGDEDLRPLVELTIFDPWATVIGSESPWFVAYNTGQIIYADGVDEDGRLTYASVNLDAAELEALLDSFGVEYFFGMEEYYDTVFKTDQRTETISVWTEEDGFYTVSVYGDLEHDPEARALAPYGFVNAFDQIIDYSNPEAEPWLPAMFEVMLWPFGSSDAAEWPEDWPALDSPYAVPRDQIISVYIDIEELERYKALANDADAVRLGGDTYTFSLRWPFPHEVVWPVGRPDDADG